MKNKNILVIIILLAVIGVLFFVLRPGPTEHPAVDPVGPTERDKVVNTIIKANLAAARIEAEFIFKDVNPHSYATLCTADNDLSTTTVGLTRIRDIINA